jgi:hypothetical protein
MLFKQRGIATHLTLSKSCRDWVRTKHLKHNVNVLDSSIIDMVPFWEIVFPPSAVGQGTTTTGSDATSQSTGRKGDALQFWHQRYYNDEIQSKEEKAQYLKLFVDKYGENSPVVVEECGQPKSIHIDQHNTLMERGQGGEVDNDM